MLVGTFGALAPVLAAVDLYGVLPYAVRPTHGRLSLRLPSSERTGWQA